MTHTLRRWLLALVLLAITFSVLPVIPVRAQTPVVQAILFYSDTCPHCHLVMTEVLPPLREQYGTQLEVLELNTATPQGNALWQAAVTIYEPELVGVPLLVVGEHALVGSMDIPASFPGLIVEYLEDGGVAWPDLPGVEEVVPQASSSAGPGANLADDGVARGILFYTPTCPHCHEVRTEVLPPLQSQYGDQLNILEIDASTPEGYPIYETLMARHGLDGSGVPALVLGDDVMIGSLDIPTRLPGLIDNYIAAGGTTWPADVPGLDALIAEAGAETGEAAPPGLVERFTRDLAGNILSVIVLVALIAGLVAVVRPRPWQARVAERFAPWGMLIVIAIGLIAAVYLSYVETTGSEAVCGPVGDCNTVQQSEFAVLFGFLPVAVLGVLGYLGILGTYAYTTWVKGPWARYTAVLTFLMALFGLLFSIFLTFLEPFVIGATCAWCLTSAVSMLFITLLSAGPGWAALQRSPRVSRASRQVEQRHG